MPRYTTLLMDADETLLDFRRSEGYALSKTLAAYGVLMTPVVHDCYHEINRVLWRLLEKREIERSVLKVRRFEMLFEAIGLVGVDAATFNAAYMNTLGSKGFLLDGALDLLKILSKRFSIYIITNGSASVQHTRFADSGILPYVDGVFISEEIGADKPSAAFFDHVVNAIGCMDRAQLLIIGDSLTSDIRGGMNAGIDTCWYHPEEEICPEDIVPTMQVRSFEQLRQILDIYE